VTINLKTDNFPVTFTFSVKATDAKAGAKFAVLTQNGRAAIPALELQGGESISKPVTFDKPSVPHYPCRSH